MTHTLPFPTPRPDAQHCIDFLLGRTAAGRPPLVEYLVDETVMRPILTGWLGREWAPESAERAALMAYLGNFIQFWYRMGYDFVRFERGLGFPIPQLLSPDPVPNPSKNRAWADQHHGLIRSWEEFERYPWPSIEKVDFFPYEYLNSHLPEGMGLIVSHAGGVFEHLSWIMSYEGLCLAVHDQPDLVQAMSERIGALMVQYYTHLLELDHIIALFPGDDMGFRSGTLIAPKHLRQFVLPWHRRFAAMAHQRGIPYFLHSCGNVFAIIPDLIAGGLDGKHSFEDAILPAEEFQARFDGQLAVLGGVDINILAGGTPEQVRARVRFLMDTCGARGRFAIGSGNSIPSYIPVVNYLAMLEEAQR